MTIETALPELFQMNRPPKTEIVMKKTISEAMGLTPRNPALDVVRGLAAFMVLIHHVRNLFFVDYKASVGLFGKLVYFLTNFGPDAVMVFFILSGYLVGGSVMRQMETERWSWRTYLITRISRLWVVLLPALVITAALDHVGLAFFHTAFYEGREGNWLIRTPIVDALSPTVFACNAFFLQTLVCHTFGSDGPLWSLANEFWYYLWFPALFALTCRRYRRQNWVPFALVVLTMFLFPSIIVGFGLWLLGALGAVLQRQNHVKFRKITTAAKWPAFGLFMAVLFASRFLHLSAEVVGLAFFLYFLCLLTKEPKPATGMIRRSAFFIAEQSYTLYLVHMPFILLIVSATVGMRLPFGLVNFIWCCGLVILTYIFAFIIYLIFERNTVKVKDFLLVATGRRDTLPHRN